MFCFSLLPLFVALLLPGKLRQKPLLIQMSLDALPEGCPDLSPNSVEAMLHISSMLHDEIHQVGSALAAVTWLLLYFGLRQKHPGFLALKRILSESPMPMCLQMVRQIANDKLEHHVEARNLSALVKLESHRTGGPRSGRWSMVGLPCWCWSMAHNRTILIKTVYQIKHRHKCQRSSIEPHKLILAYLVSRDSMVDWIADGFIVWRLSITAVFHLTY